MADQAIYHSTTSCGELTFAVFLSSDHRAVRQYSLIRSHAACIGHRHKKARKAYSAQPEVNAFNQVELHTTNPKYISIRKHSRPAYTQDAYGQRQKEWREWCLRKQYADGEIMTEGKLMAFLDQQSIGRAVRGKKAKEQSDAGESLTSVKAVGLASFELYSAAIVDHCIE